MTKQLHCICCPGIMGPGARLSKLTAAATAKNITPTSLQPDNRGRPPGRIWNHSLSFKPCWCWSSESSGIWRRPCGRIATLAIQAVSNWRKSGQCGYYCNVIRKRKLIQCIMYWCYDLLFHCLIMLWKVAASSSHWPKSLATFPSWEWNTKSRQLCQLQHGDQSSLKALIYAYTAAGRVTSESSWGLTQFKSCNPNTCCSNQKGHFQGSMSHWDW